MTRGTTTVLRIADGSTMSAFVARPSDEGRHPGLMVFHEAFGVNAHIRDVATRLAGEGYTAIAPELFHRTGTHLEGSYTDFESMRPHFSALDDAGLEADIRAAFEWLRADTGTDAGRIASVGFCLGGRVSFLANAAVPVKAAASFYGGGIAQGYLSRATALHAPMLFFWGGLDKHIRPEHTAAVTTALREAGKSFVNVEFSDADHGFFCDARKSYNPPAAQQAWGLLLDFLKLFLRER